MSELEGKIAIVTGAGTGIGKGISRAFASEGANLVLASRNEENLQKTADELKEYNSEVKIIPTDITKEEEVIALFKQTMDIFGRLDILINNSGISVGKSIDELSLQEWSQVVDLNLTGTFLCSREAMKIMKGQRGGRIVNIGSISGQMPRLNSAPYVATKFGIAGLTKATALEGRDFGIAASCVHPGNVAIERRVSSDSVQDQEPMMSVDDIAKVVLTVVTLPPHVNMYECITLPVGQVYLGRG
jgi:NADP-dependent 3-hydroxy acid dehydrogenase YdfG